MSGRTPRIPDSGVLRLDGSASSPEIPVLRVQGRIPTDSGIWGVSCPLRGLTLLRWSHLFGQLGGFAKVYSSVQSCRQFSF